MTANDYDGFADAYSAENESGLFNEYYERPAMLRLTGDVSGRRILDAGCGSGPLSAALGKGAVVTGFASSAAMVDLARQRLGDDAELYVADLAAPLPFADATFDDVVASLVLHYLEDWAGPTAGPSSASSSSSSSPSETEREGSGGLSRHLTVWRSDRSSACQRWQHQRQTWTVAHPVPGARPRPCVDSPSTNRSRLRRARAISATRPSRCLPPTQR